MSRVSVDEVLGVCKSTYRAIDLRVAIVRDGDNWASAFAAVRLTWESVSDVKARHKTLQLRHEILKNDDFAIVFAVLPFGKWKQLCADGVTGILSVGGRRIELRAPFPSGPQVDYLRPAQQQGGTFEEFYWPALEIAVGQSPTGLLNADRVLRAVAGAGYQTAPHAISAFCEVNSWPNIGYNHNLLLRLPIYAALSTASIQPVERTLSANFRRHRKLKNVTLRALFTDKFSGVPKNRTTMAARSGSSSGGGIETATAEMTLPSDANEGFVELSLSHPVIGELHRQLPEVRSLLPAAERNLLLEVLKCFCPIERLEEFVTDPSAQRSSFKINQSSFFEHHVAWLFSLFGFSPIVLGNQEQLKTDRVQHGSIDIIAVSGHTLVLVACTIGAPKSEDFVNLWHLRDVLTAKLSPHTSAIVLPVLVTGITSPKTHEEMGNGTGYIPILDKNRLGALTKRAFTGDANELMQFLQNL